MLPVAIHAPVTGLYISALARLPLMAPLAESPAPPAISTVPSASSVTVKPLKRGVRGLAAKAQPWVGGVMVSVVLPDTEFSEAVILAEPTAMAVTSPDFALTVALSGLAEDQLTVSVRSLLLESE